MEVGVAYDLREVYLSDSRGLLGYGMLRGDPDGVADVAAAANRCCADEVDVTSGSDLDLSSIVGNDAGLVGENSRLQEVEVRAIAYR